MHGGELGRLCGVADASTEGLEISAGQGFEGRAGGRRRPADAVEHDCEQREHGVDGSVRFLAGGRFADPGRRHGVGTDVGDNAECRGFDADRHSLDEPWLDDRGEDRVDRVVENHLLTDVVAVETNYGQADSSPIALACAAELRSYGFAAGSMGPKVEAACRFAERSGGVAAIGSLTDAEGVLAGTSGTRVTG